MVDLILMELFDTPKEPLEGSYNPIEDVLETSTSSLLDTWELHPSGRIVRAPDRFMFLGDVVSNEHDLDPNKYNESILTKIREIDKVLWKLRMVYDRTIQFHS